MTRIVYSATTPFGAIVAEAVDHIYKAQDALARAVAVANSVSGGGATPANLEGSTEFGVAVGDGSDFYTAINDMKTNLATVTVTALSQIDMGG